MTCNAFAIPFLFALVGELVTSRERAQSERARGVRGIFDPLQCPGVDLAKFSEECRADLFPDLWNHWRLLKSTADGSIEQAGYWETDIEKQAKALLVKAIPGSVRHVEVKIGGPANPWETPVLRDRNSVCMQPMLLRPSSYQPPYVEVYVRFVVRGLDTNIPWVARKVDWGFGSDCPIDADWLLDAVFTPSSKDVPPVDTDSPLPPTVDPDNAITAEWSWETKAGLMLLAVLGVAAVAGYAARSFR